MSAGSEYAKDFYDNLGCFPPEMVKKVWYGLLDRELNSPLYWFEIPIVYMLVIAQASACVYLTLLGFFGNVTTQAMGDVAADIDPTAKGATTWRPTTNMLDAVNATLAGL